MCNCDWCDDDCCCCGTYGQWFLGCFICCESTENCLECLECCGICCEIAAGSKGAKKRKEKATEVNTQQPIKIITI